nr:hypothetical protein BaRGS_032478 [Batillaria attramentaria]
MIMVEAVAHFLHFLARDRHPELYSDFLDEFPVDDFPVNDFPVIDFSVNDFPVNDFPVNDFPVIDFPDSRGYKHTLVTVPRHALATSAETSSGKLKLLAQPRPSAAEGGPPRREKETPTTSGTE